MKTTNNIYDLWSFLLIHGLVWLSERKTIPGRAGGTVRDMAVTVAIPIYGQDIVLTRF